MKRKLSTVFLILIAAAACAFGLAACESIGGGNADEINGNNHIHSYTETVIPPTCTQEGYTLYTCSCGDSYTDNYIFEGHDWVYEAFSAETHLKKCSKCGETEGYLAHTWDDNVCRDCGYDAGGSKGMSWSLGNDGTYYILSSVRGWKDTQIEIPATHNGLPVTTIGGGAFSNRSSLTSITIPDSVTSIGESAFEYCYGLTNITIPNSVTSIGRYAFLNCSGLTSVTIGNSVSSIGDWAFSGCHSLTSITIPDGVTSISDWAFNGCRGLKSITIGNSVTSIGDYAFYGCRSLTSITIPDSVTSIGYGAFEFCNGLTRVSIGIGVSSIGNYAFLGCYKLVEVYDKSSKITITAKSTDNGYVGYYALHVYKPSDNESTRLATTDDGFIFYAYNPEIYLLGYTGTDTNLKLPSEYVPWKYATGRYNIYDYAFYGCTWLESLDCGGVYGIGNYAFRGCTALSSVTFKYVSAIGKGAFYGCTALTRAGIPDRIETIEQGTFRNCYSLTSVIIPRTVTAIASNAFEGCYRLVEVCNYSSLTITARSSDNGHVGYYALNVYTPTSGVSKLATTDEGYIFYENGNNVYLVGYTGTQTELTLPDNFNGKNYTIYQYAFYNCSKLTSITIPDSVTFIGDYAFAYCSGLRNIYYTGDIASWCGISGLRYLMSCNTSHALYINGKVLTELVIPDGVTSIGDYTFYGCSSLTSVTIPDSVTSIGDFAFSYCSSLTSVTIGNSVTSIEIGAFSNCSSLESLTIPDSVISIGNGAFSGCSSLTNIYYTGDIAGWCGISGLSNLMSYNKIHALYINNEILTELVIPDGVTSIGDYTFYGCILLTSVTIPDSVSSIGSEAFAYIGDYVFTGSSGIIQIENGVSYVDKWVIDCDTSVTTVTLRNDTKGIADDAFSGCSGLTSITIPDSVTSIGDWAFYNCSELTSVYYLGSAEDWAEISIGNYNTSLTDATRYYYSDVQPTDGGNYWHYDTDGVTPVVWAKQS